MNQPDSPQRLTPILAATWALLLGFGILMLGDGLQATLLAVRADREGFSATLTGLIMSSFYVGFLSGSLLAPRIMIQVGHVRVFAALAALAAAVNSSWVASGLPYNRFWATVLLNRNESWSTTATWHRNDASPMSRRS